MTRFARAKGSKSSNQKAPEDSTPWEVMKEQIIQSKKDTEQEKLRKEAEQQRVENYNNFLKDQKVQKRKATWCDFPEAESNKNQNVSANQCSETIIKKKKKNKQENVDYAQSQLEKQSQLLTNDSNNSKKHNVSDKSDKSTIKKLSNKKENMVDQVKTTSENVSRNNSEQMQFKEKSKNKNKKKKLQQSHNNVDDKKENIKSEKNELNTKLINEQYKNINMNQNLKKKKNKERKPIRRKEINDRSFQLIINGKEIELVRYDGFPVMKKDADRLEELKNNMIKKGIPKSEVQRNMKLERRRAEKALARLKREVCYNCRKGGHNLSDCPDLKSKIPGVDSAEGVCFKCGSTEHRQFECKVQRDKEFRFATCFICKEAGHIARQCPDNPKGLYPNGGSCKLCGDVTHLKKDCPTTNDKKEASSIKLHTLDRAENIEDISQKEENVREVMKKPKKIKF